MAIRCDNNVDQWPFRVQGPPRPLVQFPHPQTSVCSYDINCISVTPHVETVRARESVWSAGSGGANPLHFVRTPAALPRDSRAGGHWLQGQMDGCKRGDGPPPPPAWGWTGTSIRPGGPGFERSRRSWLDPNHMANRRRHRNHRPTGPKSTASAGRGGDTSAAPAAAAAAWRLDPSADLLKRGRSTMPLLPSKSCGTALWDVHSFTAAGPQEPPSFTLWLEPPHFCCAYLHNRKVLITPK